MVKFDATSLFACTADPVFVSALPLNIEGDARLAYRFVVREALATPAGSGRILIGPQFDPVLTALVAELRRPPGLEIYSRLLGYLADRYGFRGDEMMVYYKDKRGRNRVGRLSCSTEGVFTWHDASS